MVSEKTIKNERSLKRLIFKNLNKEIHPATKPSVDFIYKILEEAYASGLRYDVTDMKRVIVEFASNSTNNAPYCLNLALKMKYVSDHEELESPLMVSDSRLVFYDVEVFPNLLLICWKYHNTDTVVRMINPSPKDVEDLLKHPLVGFNNRRYDNHILYSRVLGYTNEKIYQLSKRIIVSKDKTAYFRDAYGLSHADVYDYSTEKKSLKHWQIELGIFHSEMEYDWDQPLSEELWEEVGDYCANDVRSTELVHHHRIEDYHAREILAELSGLRINDTTVRHTSRIIFGKVSNYKDSFVYPDLSKQFPGYEFDAGVSTYRGETVGEGGYVYAQPGIYNNVIYMDVASMYPTSIELLNIFGEYTKQYSDLKKARILIKDGKLEDAGRMFNGALAKYLKDPSSSVELAYALKIALNTVYGFTAAPYDNPFRDNRNVDNVVAKRGSLFMIDLKHALLDRGCKPIHFKTDSVKIADYDPSDILFVENFGRKYGYNFGLEGTYEKMALINDAVLVGKWKDGGEWDAVGARFARPYVFKTLFSKEPIEFEDLVETRSVRKGVMYVEMAEGPMGFVGRVGTFCPMKTLGGTLYRIQGDKKYAVTGTKGYKWLSADAVKELEKEEDIDMSYFDTAVDEAVAKIAEFGDTTIFLGE